MLVDTTGDANEMKSIKGPAHKSTNQSANLPKLAVKLSPTALAQVLAPHGEDAVMRVLDLLGDEEAWPNERVGKDLALALLTLGARDELLAWYLGAVADSFDGAGLDAAANVLVLALDDDERQQVIEAVNDLDDDVEMDTRGRFLELLVESGLVSDWLWQQLELVRDEDPLLWTSFAGDYDDDRVLPLLRSILDDVEPKLTPGVDLEEDGEQSEEAYFHNLLIMSAHDQLAQRGLQRPEDDAKVAAILAVVGVPGDDGDDGDD